MFSIDIMNMGLFARIIISIIGVVWVNVGFCKYNHKPILTHVALLYFFSGFEMDDRCLSFMCCRNNPYGRAESLRFYSETSHIAKQKTAPKKQQQPQLFFFLMHCAHFFHLKPTSDCFVEIT